MEMEKAQKVRGRLFTKDNKMRHLALQGVNRKSRTNASKDGMESSSLAKAGQRAKGDSNLARTPGK